MRWVALLLLLCGPAGPVPAQSAFPWEHPLVPKMAARKLDGQLAAHVGLRFWMASSASDQNGSVAGILESAQRCLDHATLRHGLRVVLDPRGVFQVRDRELERMVTRSRYITASGLERGPFRSVEAPYLNVFIVPDVAFSGHALLGATAALDAEHDAAGRILAFRGARDIQLSTDAEGDVLAHEILHAWGGLVDRHGDSTNLMDDRMMGCTLTPEQTTAAVRHSLGGPSEVAR